MAVRLRNLVESEEYKDQIEKLGGARDADEGLRGLLWSLAYRPEVWPVVPGFTRLRMAWTIAPGGPLKRRALQLWFEIRENDPEYVDLLFIEPFDDSD